MKKLNSAEELVRIFNTHEIGMDLLTEVRLHKAELDNENELKHMEKLKQRYDILNAYVVMKENKSANGKDWVSTDYKVAVKAMKKDSDGKMPTKKDDLVKMYNDIKNCDKVILAEYNDLASMNEFEE